MTHTIVDTSILRSVATCDTQAALRYVLGYTAFEDRGYLRAGTAVHAGLAAYFSTGSADAGLAAFAAEYEPWATEHPDAVEGRLSIENVRACLRAWMLLHPPDRLPFFTTPNLIEVGFAVPLSDDGTVTFVGRMDGLVQSYEHAWYVLENKTTGRIDELWRRDFKSSPQLSGYIWAAQQTLEKPVVGAFLLGLELSQLPSDAVRKCRNHGVPYAECGPMHVKFTLEVEHRAPHQIEDWRRTATRLAHRFLDLKARITSLDEACRAPQQGIFNGGCSRCQFYDFCAVGRPMSGIPLTLRYEPWEPYTHATKEVIPPVTGPVPEGSPTPHTRKDHE